MGILIIRRSIGPPIRPAPRASATQGTSSQPKQSVPIASGSQTSASAFRRREDTESSVPASTNVALTSSTKYMPVLLAKRSSRSRHATVTSTKFGPFSTKDQKYRSSRNLSLNVSICRVNESHSQSTGLVRNGQASLADL